MASTINMDVSGIAARSAGASGSGRSSEIAKLQKQLKELTKELQETVKNPSQAAKQKAKALQQQIELVQMKIAQLQAEEAKKKDAANGTAAPTASAAPTKAKSAMLGNNVDEFV